MYMYISRALSLWIVSILTTGTNSYIQYNNKTAQDEYYRNEMFMFGTPSNSTPFDGVLDVYLNQTDQMYPITYKMSTDNPKYNIDALESFRNIVQINNKTFHKTFVLTHSLRTITGFITDLFWYANGWSNEMYMTPDDEFPLNILYTSSGLESAATDAAERTVPIRAIYYFHGLNPLNAVENSQFIGPLAAHVATRIILNADITCNNQLNGNETLITHIDQAVRYIEFDMKRNNITEFHLIGDSYGSIRMAIIARRYPHIFAAAKSIVWSDPLTMNLPYSPTFSTIWECVMNTCNRTDPLIMILNDIDQYEFLLYNLDLYEWSLDSELLMKYKDKCSIIIGKRDKYVAKIGSSSPIATNSCHFHYTDDVHGGMLINDINDYIELVEYPPYEKTGMFGFRQQVVHWFHMGLYKTFQLILP